MRAVAALLAAVLVLAAFVIVVEVITGCHAPRPGYGVVR